MHALNEVWDDETAKAHRKILQAAVNFKDCMAEFTRPELLDGDAKPRCPACKKEEKAIKQLDLWNTPQILVIHLKRLLPGRKLFTFVECPLRGFDPSPFLALRTDEKGAPIVAGAATASSDGKTAAAGASAGGGGATDGKSAVDKPVYDLYGVVNHFGASGGGHYVTYTLCPKDGKWYTFNDSYVTPMVESEVIASSAYMLFYQRRGLPNNLGFLPENVQKQAKDPLKEEQKKLLAQSSEDGCCATCAVM